MFKRDHNGELIAEQGTVLVFRVSQPTREEFTDLLINSVKDHLVSETVDALFAAYEQGYDIRIVFEADNGGGPN